jgi:hypothetical protein
MRKSTLELFIPIKPDYYTAADFMRFLGKPDKGNVIKLLNQLGVERQAGKKIRGNIFEVFYIWEGLEHYLKPDGKYLNRKRKKSK